MREPIYIVGPTASGKSAVVIELAERVGGEIVSVDSMQVYRGMDIGSAKVSAEEQARVPHHLLDIVDITEPYDAACFVRDASDAVREIRARGRTPIFCGGTGLYLKAFLDGLGDAPPADLDLRAELERMSDGALLDELERLDKATFDQIDRRNRRRIVRAVEVIRLTGRPFAEQKATWSMERDSIPNLFVLERERDELIPRIDERVEHMFEQGLLEETRRLMDQGLETNRTAMQAIGYRQVVEHLRSELAIDETKELIKIRTRQFAKRQRTWFRHQLPGESISLTGRKTIAVVEELAARFD